ncbi:putative reverse transcriptase domain-containing protein, partial [Tanacetum coccineum]
VMPLKSVPSTQATVWRKIKESVDAAIAAERARHTNVGNDARGSGLVRGRDVTRAIHEWFEKTESVFEISECAEGKKVKFFAATLEGPALTWWKSKIETMGLETNLRVKEYNIVAYTQRFNKLALMYPRMVELESVKIDAYIRGLTDNIKGEVTSSRPDNLNETINQKQGNVRAMTTALNDGKVGHKARYCKENSVATSANAQPIPTCYDCGEQGHTRNRCPKKVKQEEIGEVYGRAYVIKDVES